MNPDKQKEKKTATGNSPSYKKVLKKSMMMFLSMSPILFGVIGLVGLVQVYVTPKMLSSVFSGNPLGDTLKGTFGAALVSGNPVNSYILGTEFLHKGVSFYAVTAFILSWVTLGVTHLAAEVEFFGMRFTIWRNILTLFGTLLVALFTGLTMGALQ